MSETEDSQHTHSANDPALRAKALESLLVEKGLLASDAVDALVEAYEKDIGPMNGAKVVLVPGLILNTNNACWRTAPMP